MEQSGWTALAYSLSVLVAVAFATYAFAFGWLRQRRANKAVDTEEFVTARGTCSFWRIGWSFYAGAVGAWVITAPPLFASSLGIPGVIVYAITSGLPILLIAFLGGRITAALPHVFSLTDYTAWRYGPVAKSLVAAICLFNMSIALLAEYSAIGSIFADFVNGLDWPIILVIGVLTLAYTAYGGLIVSIATDQIQGIASIILATVLVIYVAVTYRIPIPQPLPAGLGWDNQYGYISIFTLGLSLATATVFSEAMWQRVWASTSRRTLHAASGLGCGLIIVIVFLSGFGGWLALVGGLVDPETTSINLYLFQVLAKEPNGQASLNNVIGLVVVLLAVIMNEGAVDSLQNGIASVIASQWLKNRPLMWSRAALVVVNIPLIVLGTQGYSVLSVFLVANMLCVCSAFPVMIGLWSGGRHFFTESGFIFSVFLAITGTIATATATMWDPANPGGSISAGAYYAWFGNVNYDWPPFLWAICFSVGGMLLWGGVATLLRKAFGVRGPGVSGVLMKVPSLRHATGCPDWTPPSEDSVDEGSGKNVEAGDLRPVVGDVPLHTGDDIKPGGGGQGVYPTRPGGAGAGL